MKSLNDTTADTLTAISSVSALAHMATSLQPLISALAGIVAILSGAAAFWYYIKKGNAIK
jgi:lysozyme family protein